jgi:hypothetical protein
LTLSNWSLCSSKASIIKPETVDMLNSFFCQLLSDYQTQLPLWLSVILTNNIQKWELSTIMVHIWFLWVVRQNNGKEREEETLGRPKLEIIQVQGRCWNKFWIWNCSSTDSNTWVSEWFDWSFIIIIFGQRIILQ